MELDESQGLWDREPSKITIQGGKHLTALIGVTGCGKPRRGRTLFEAHLGGRCNGHHQGGDSGAALV